MKKRNRTFIVTIPLMVVLLGFVLYQWHGHLVDLIDCLQYGDKGWLLSYDEEFRAQLGFASRREMREALKEMENLRNNLAHTQAIIPSGWARIVIACSRMEQSLDTVRRLSSPPSAAPDGDLPGD